MLLWRIIIDYNFKILMLIVYKKNKIYMFNTHTLDFIKNIIKNKKII